MTTGAVEQQKASRVMHEDYNATVTGWVHESIAATVNDLASCVDQYFKVCPERFAEGPDAQPFVIADFGCATGASSIVPLRALIEAVRSKAPSLTI
jgi:hypothetical protein